MRTKCWEYRSSANIPKTRINITNMANFGKKIEYLKKAVQNLSHIHSIFMNNVVLKFENLPFLFVAR